MQLAESLIEKAARFVRLSRDSKIDFARSTQYSSRLSGAFVERASVIGMTSKDFGKRIVLGRFLLSRNGVGYRIRK